MAKKMLIDSTHAEETRVVVVDGNKVEEFDFESENKRQLVGNIYLAKITRVEPSLQAAFVDYGGNRHGFLAFTEIHPDYYQIPLADREKLLAEEAQYARAMSEEDVPERPKRRARSPRSTGQPKQTMALSEGAPNGTDETVFSETLEPDDDSSGLVDVPETTASERRPEGNGPIQTDAEASPDSFDDSLSYESDDDVRAETRPPVRRVRRYKIQEVIKVRQILLVQVVKEERGNKGAALTTYLSLAGRYCVLMPNTMRGGGISRKITNISDRKKLKDIADKMEVPEGAGVIVRTAGAKRSTTEVKLDYEYLLRQWEQVRDLTLKSIAPAAIYEEGNLIKRSIRDLFNSEIDEVFVQGEDGFREAREYMKMLMPSHVNHVKHYAESVPLFSRYQVDTYLDAMFNPTVQLKSGGYIVIGITEALVAIDVNSGKSTKESSIEETALRTNLEAAEEVARQLKLRDLAGLIVIDFIDMDERRNNTAVEKRIKDRLKNDRARIQVGRISGFGLMEMSRQRLRPGMLEASTQPCAACNGTGFARSNDSLAIQILREIEEEGTRGRSREVLITAPFAIANYLLNEKRDHIMRSEMRFRMAIRIETDPYLISPEHKMEKFKTTSRQIAKPSARSTVTIDSVEPVGLNEEDRAIEPPVETLEEQPKKRRRRRGGKNRNKQQGAEINKDATSEAMSKVAADPATAEANPVPSEPSASHSVNFHQKVVPEIAETTQPVKDADGAGKEASAKPRKATAKPKTTTTGTRSKVAVKSASKPDDKKADVPAQVDIKANAAAQSATDPKAAGDGVPEEKPKPVRKIRVSKSESPKKAAPKEKTTKAKTTSKSPKSRRELEVAAAEPKAATAKPKKSGWWSRETEK